MKNLIAEIDEKAKNARKNKRRISAVSWYFLIWKIKYWISMIEELTKEDKLRFSRIMFNQS